jgi:hypothetical protein
MMSSLIGFTFCRWYTLKCKPGQNKNDYRGDLEVRTSFTVKALTSANDKALGSTSDLGKSKGDKAKGSLQSLNKAASNFGGSLLSLGTKVCFTLFQGRSNNIFFCFN